MEDSVKYGIAFIFCLFVVYLIYLYLFDTPKVATTTTVITPPPVNTPSNVVTTNIPSVANSPLLNAFLEDENNNKPEFVVPATRTVLRLSDPLDTIKANKEVILGFNKPHSITPNNMGVLSAVICKDTQTKKKYAFLQNSYAPEASLNMPTADRFMLVDAGAGKVYIKHVKSGLYLSLTSMTNSAWSPSGRPDLSGPLKLVTLVENPHEEKWTITNKGDQIYRLVYRTGEEVTISQAAQSLSLDCKKPFSELIGYSKYDAWNAKGGDRNYMTNLYDLTILVVL